MWLIDLMLWRNCAWLLNLLFNIHALFLTDPVLVRKARSQVAAYFDRWRWASDAHVQDSLDAEGYLALSYVVGFPRMKELGVNLETLVSACYYHPNLILDVSKQRAKPRWNVADYSKDRLKASSIRLKCFPLSANETMVEAFFQSLDIEVHRLTLYKTNNLFNGSGTFIASSVEEAERIEERFKKQPVCWPRMDVQLLIGREKNHQKSAASPGGAEISADEDVSDLSLGQLGKEHHHYLERIKQKFGELFKQFPATCSSVTPQGPFFHIISVHPCKELPKLERHQVFRSAVMPQKKASLRHAEFLFARFIHGLLCPEEPQPYALASAVTPPDEAEQKAQLHLNRLAEAKRLQSIFREIGPHNMREYAETEGYLTLQLGAKREHTKNELSKFTKAMKNHAELREHLDEYDQTRKALLKNRGFHDFMKLRQEQRAAEAAGLVPKKESDAPKDPAAGPEDDSVSSDDDPTMAFVDDETLERQAEAALEQLEVNVKATTIEIGFMQEPNVMCVLWRTSNQLSIAFEELTPRVNFNWARHNIKYGMRNVLKNMPSAMWLCTDLGTAPPPKPPSPAPSSSTASEPPKDAPSEPSNSNSATPSTASSEPSGPTYIDFYIPIDSAPRLTAQERFQSRRVGTLDFTINNAFAQSTMIHIHVDLKTLPQEDIVSLLAICKSLTEMGLLKSNYAVPITCGYSPSTPLVMAAPDSKQRAPAPVPRVLVKDNDEAPFERPTRLKELDFWVLWKLTCLVTHNYVRMRQIDNPLVDLLLEYPRTTAFRVLEKLEGNRKRLFDFLANLKQELLPHAKGTHMQGEHFKLKENFALVAHVTITPTEMLCEGPRVEISNRLLRTYAPLKERFVRVAFTSGLSGGLTGGSIRNCGKSAVRKRVGGILERGFEIDALKKLLDFGTFLFLVSSPSQLRTQKAWMYCAPPTAPPGFTLPIDVPGIRKWLGEFSGIFNVAMFSARLGQGLSSTYHCFDVEPEWLVRIPDIERNGYTFSDGCASISPRIAEMAAKALNLDYIPSAFQIRLAGIKGVVSVDTRLEGHVIHVRKSMEKFKAPGHLAFEVVTWTRPLPAHLNKQIIQILSALGLPDEKLIAVQTAAFNSIAASTFPSSFESPEIRAQHVERLAKTWGQKMRKGSLEHRAVAMLRAGFDLHKEPYLKSIVTAIGLRSLQEIHSMARIPVERGRYAIGILDELGVLQSGQVYFKSSQPHDRSATFVHTGLLCVSRSPCLHPGDARFVTGVDVPELAHMVDVLVFPQTGDRPIPDECSGGDLDGDQYLILWGDDFIPPVQDTPAFAHETSTQGATESKDDNEVYPHELADFFVNYIFDDKLSQIADAHTYHADKSEKGVFDEKCLKLAQAHNIAVDAPKTGKVVPQMEELSVPSWPDFMNVNKASVYLSKKVLGTLFRRSDEEFQTLATDVPSDAELVKSFDEDMKMEGHEAYIQEAIAARNEYIEQMATSMQIFRIHDEASAITGETLYRFRSERRDWESKKEGFEFVQADLRTRFRQVFGLDAKDSSSSSVAIASSSSVPAESVLNATSTSNSAEIAPEAVPSPLLPIVSSPPVSESLSAVEDASPSALDLVAATPSLPSEQIKRDDAFKPTQEQLLRASAWYVVTYDPQYKRTDGVTMWSFPWLVDELLCVIKSNAVVKRLAQAPPPQQMSALPEQPLGVSSVNLLYTSSDSSLLASAGVPADVSMTASSSSSSSSIEEDSRPEPLISMRATAPTQPIVLAPAASPQGAIDLAPTLVDDQPLSPLETNPSATVTPVLAS